MINKKIILEISCYSYDDLHVEIKKEKYSDYIFESIDNTKTMMYNLYTATLYKHIEANNE